MDKLKTDFNTCVNNCDIYDMVCHEGCSSSYQYGLETCPCRSMCPDGCNYGVGVGKFPVDIIIGFPRLLEKPAYSRHFGLLYRLDNSFVFSYFYPDLIGQRASLYKPLIGQTEK